MAVIKKFRIKSFKNPQPIISLENISLSFGNTKILDNVSFKINHGQILGMLGPNGVGKSTIFNLITGLIKPDYGKISFDGTVVNDYPIYLRTTKFKIGYVPQYGGYFGDLTLLENLKAIAEIVIIDEKLIKYKIDQLIAKFELDAIRDTKAKYLSGGQKKKLVIALALLSEPKILLLDECFAALDVLTIKMLQEIIVNLQTENNITICICDHQARDLLSCVDVAIILSNCKIIAQGSPNDLVNNTEAKNAYFGDSFKFQKYYQLKKRLHHSTSKYTLVEIKA
jgi:lipopolysaccharide export system ATP-binding protein